MKNIQTIRKKWGYKLYAQANIDNEYVSMMRIGNVEWNEINEEYVFIPRIFIKSLNITALEAIIKTMKRIKKEK